MALVSPVLPIALRKVDIPDAAKIPPKINQSHIAVLGVRRGMRFAGSQFSVCSIRLSMFPEVMTAPVAFSMSRECLKSAFTVILSAVLPILPLRAF